MRIPVLYVGFQAGDEVLKIPSFHLIDEPSGSTKVFTPERHVIIGLSFTAKEYGVEIPGGVL